MTLDDKIIRSPDLEYVPETGGYGQVLFRCLKENADSVTQVDGITGEKDTCSAYLQRCVRTAIALSSKGIKKGDIITISCYNHLNSSVPYIGALFIGAITANIDPTVTSQETIYLLKKVKPKMIFIERENVEHYEKAIECAQIETELVIFGNSNKHTQFSEFLKESKDEHNFKPIEIQNLNETGIIVFSSGSTGCPKGICLSYFSLGYQSMRKTAATAFQNFVILTFSSIYWFTYITFIITSIVNNYTRVVLPKFDENIMWQVIAKYKVNLAVMVPRHLINMFKIEHQSNSDKSSLLELVLAGTKISDVLLEDFQLKLPTTRVVQAYGLTECGGVALQFDPKIKHDEEKRYKSLGHPTDGISYKVVDVETEELLGPNQPGELRLKSSLQMTGYYDEDASNCWDSDGWLKTGDIVYYDEQHYFYYVERIKEMIKYRGSQVYPCIVEDILLAHPNISEAVVIGVSDPLNGDLPTAIVVLKKSNNNSVSSEEIIKYVNDKVDDKSKLRGGIKIVQHLPCATSGKPKRKIIKELFRDGKL